jgi:SAM-dependent methyltransferase
VSIPIYDALANEYYDSIRHPTCSDFREASLLAFDQTRIDSSPPISILETGAGRSVFAERPLSADCTLYLLDESIPMLHASGLELLRSSQTIQGCAESLPFRSEAFDMVIAVLGDPYNNSEFWTSVSRVLKNGGSVFYTTPSFEWAMKFRQIEGGSRDHARFVTTDGKCIDTPSVIPDHRRQRQMITDAGLQVGDRIDVGAGQIARRSSKTDFLEEDEPVVTAWIASKG